MINKNDIVLYQNEIYAVIDVNESKVHIFRAGELVDNLSEFSKYPDKMGRLTSCNINEIERVLLSANKVCLCCKSKISEKLIDYSTLLDGTVNCSMCDTVNSLK